MNRKAWLLTLVLCIVAALVTVVVRRAPRTVPLSQCSEVYQRYHDTPGIHASFIKDKQINDTLRLDMTLLVANDSLAYANLLKSIGKSDEFITDILSLGGTMETRYSGSFRRGELGSLGDPDDANNEVESIFPIRKTVAIFHTHTAREVEVVLLKSYYSKINIEDSF